MTQPPPRLIVTADLRLDVDGVRAQIAGEGDRLRVTADHPTRLLRRAAQLTNVTGRSRARAGLEQLAAQGLTVVLAGPRRDLVRIGAGAGRMHVQLAVPPAWRRALAASAAVVLAAGASRFRTSRMEHP